MACYTTKRSHDHGFEVAAKDECQLSVPYVVLWKKHDYRVRKELPNSTEPVELGGGAEKLRQIRPKFCFYQKHQNAISLNFIHHIRIENLTEIATSLTFRLNIIQFSAIEFDCPNFRKPSRVNPRKMGAA